jgi:hypothetical protein
MQQGVCADIVEEASKEALPTEIMDRGLNLEAGVCYKLFLDSVPLVSRNFFCASRVRVRVRVLLSILNFKFKVVLVSDTRSEAAKWTPNAFCRSRQDLNPAT